MKKISLLLVFLMAISLFGANAANLWEENLNGASTGVSLGVSNFTYVARPSDNVSVNTTPVADDAGVDRVLMSGKLDSKSNDLKYAEFTFTQSVTGKVVFEGDFRVEERPVATSAGGTIKFFDIFSSTGTSLFALTSGSTEDGGYKLRPLYHNGSANVTSSINLSGSLLKYKQWYTMKAILDTTNGTVSAYINNIKIVDNMYFYSKVSATAIVKVRANHANGSQVNSTTPDLAHIGAFMVDNLKIYEFVEDATVTSSVYTIGDTDISNIPQNTAISAFLSNLTFSQGGSGSVYTSDGITLKTAGTIARGDILKLSPGSKSYVLKLQGWEINETFNGASDSSITVANSWKKIARPVDGVTVDYATVEQVADNAGIDRALMSAIQPDQGKISAVLSEPATGGVKIEMDVRVESADETAGMGNIKFAEIYGKNESTQVENAIFGVTTGTYTSSSFRLRPIYGVGASLGNIGPSLAYNTWHHITLIVDTETDTGSIYVNNTPIMLNIPFFNTTAQNITRVLSYNNKTTVITHYMLDNLKVSQTEILPVPSSTLYIFDHAASTVSEIPITTTVEEFMSNINYSKAASASIIDKKTGLEKTTGVIDFGDTFVVNPGNLVYKLNFAGVITYDDFDGAIPAAGWTIPDNYSQVGRPADGLATVPDPSNKAIYLENGNNTTAKMAKYTMSAQGDIEVNMDFLVKENVTNGSVNQVKICEIFGMQGTTTRTAVNVSVTTQFTLTYSDGTNYAAKKTKPIEFGKWHTLKVIANTQTDKSTIWLDGTLFAENYNFQGVGTSDATPNDVDKFTEFRLYHGPSQTAQDQNAPDKPSPFYFDNVKVRYLSDSTELKSSIYEIGTNKITNVLKNTTADSFISKLTLPVNASAALYSDYANKTLRTGNVENGDKYVVIAENGRTTGVYDVEIVPNVAVKFTNAIGSEVTALSQISDGIICASANVINIGLNNNGSDFVIMIVSYQNGKMLSAKYKTYSLAQSEAKQVIKVEDFSVPTGSNIKISAFVWNKINGMIPLSTPVDIQ